MSIYQKIYDEIFNRLIYKDSFVFTEIMIIIIAMAAACLAAAYVMNKSLLYLENKTVNRKFLGIIFSSFRKPIIFLFVMKIFLYTMLLVNKKGGSHVASIASSLLLKIDAISYIIFISWVIIDLTDGCIKLWIDSSHGERNRARHPIAGGINIMMKIVIGFIALINISSNMGINPKTTLTFSGLGSVIIGFAAKDILSNFLSAIMVYMDRPFTINEEISIPSMLVSGTVERVGWRITKIRQYDNIPIYIPNSTFMSTSVENISRITNRRLLTYINVYYNLSHEIRLILKDIKKCIVNDNAIDSTQTAIICLHSIGKRTICIKVYCYAHTSSFTEFHSVKQNILLNINRTLRDVHNTNMFVSNSEIVNYDEDVHVKYALENEITSTTPEEKTKIENKG